MDLPENHLVRSSKFTEKNKGGNFNYKTPK